MNKLTFIHTADWHADNEPVKQKKLEASLGQLVDYCKSHKVNAIIHAGDIWERKQSYADKSGVPLVITYLRHLSKLVDFIFITKGNNSHDEPGSISLLHQLEKNIYAYEYPVVLGIVERVSNGDNVFDLLRMDEPFDNQSKFWVDYIVSLVPYPTKAGFVTNTSIDNNNADFLEKFEQIFEMIGDVTRDYKCPKVLGFHGNVVGSRLSTGQTLVSQDIMVAPATLEKAKHHYYALGHIHLMQMFKHNMGYSGSIYNKNWGETEQKSFELVEFEIPSDPELIPLLHTQHVLLSSARPMVKVEAEFTPHGNSDFIFDNNLEEEKFANAEVRVRITLKENDRKLLTDDILERLDIYFGYGTKIEFKIIPDQRESRSEKIMECRTLLDEVKEYAGVIEFPVTNGIEAKTNQLNEVEVF